MYNKEFNANMNLRSAYKSLSDKEMEQRTVIRKLMMEKWDLKRINAELLKALQMCVNYVGSVTSKSEPAMNAYLKASEAIKKATT